MKFIKKHNKINLPAIDTKLVYPQRTATIFSKALAVIFMVITLLLLYRGQDPNLPVAFQLLTLLGFFLPACYLVGYKKVLTINLEQKTIVQAWGIFGLKHCRETPISEVDRVLCFKYRLRRSAGFDPRHMMLCLGTLDAGKDGSMSSHYTKVIIKDIIYPVHSKADRKALKQHGRELAEALAIPYENFNKVLQSDYSS